MESTKSERAWSAATWVLVVLAVGLALGAVLAWLIPIPPGGNPSGSAPPPGWVAQVGVLLSTLSLALLVALLVVYARSYRATRAPYVLGLVIFLVVLFFETAVNSPLLLRAFGLGPGAIGPFLALGGLLMSAALSIFLYLSLQ